MTQEQLTAFIANAKGNTSLQGQLKAAADTNAVVSIAEDVGFSISVDDLAKAQSEISDEELEGAPGGIYPTGTLFPKKAWRWLVNSKERELQKYQN